VRIAQGELPRDARDTVFLLAVVAWVVLPQVQKLPLWCDLTTAALLLWRGWLAVTGRPLPSRWVLIALISAAIGATYYSHSTLVGRDAGVTFVVVLLALKTLEMRARRDAFVVFFLGFFALLSNFFYSQGLLTALAMIVGLLGLLTALVNSHMPVGRPPLLRAARSALGMALLGAPIMATLFVLFPRVAPLWSVNDSQPAGHTGLSNSMQVGNIAALALDDSVALRVRFEGATPPQRELYFRGPVLSRYDGVVWTALRAARDDAPARANLQVRGPAVRYQVTQFANNQAWLPLLDVAPDGAELAGQRLSMSDELVWSADHALNDLVRYSAQSYPQYQYGPQRRSELAPVYLYLPQGQNPRTVQLAQELRKDARYAFAGDATLVDAVLERLRTGGYTYTLEPGVFGSNSADAFWFDVKAGFCEHIASSFVILMRALDIPARVVTGYQGGEPNAIDGNWTVRQSDAHAWAEVWLAGRGWVRVDPTAAVSPGRNGTFTHLVPPPSMLSAAINVLNPNFFYDLRALWEAANSNWNQWVLSYGQTRQFDLLRQMGFTAPDWEDLSYVFIGLVLGFSLIGYAWTLVERLRQDPWLRLLHKAQTRLRDNGLRVHPNMAPRSLALALAQARVDAPLRLALENWLLRLEAWRYATPQARAAAGETLATLRRDFGQLPWPRRRADWGFGS